MSLQARIQALSTVFINDILAAMRGVSIDELASGSGSPKIAARAVVEEEDDDAAPVVRTKKAKSSGRLARRSDEDMAKIVEEIVAVVRKHPEGIKAEALREELSLEKKELPGPMKVALETRVLRKEGEKRATCYFLGKKSLGATASKKTAKPAKKKVVAKAAPVKAAPKKKKAKARSKSNGAAGASTAAAPSAGVSAEA